MAGKNTSPSNTPYITRSIENAQKRVEAHNFQIRKQVLEYDNVMNKQREVIHRQRRQVLEGENLEESIKALIEEAAEKDNPAVLRSFQSTQTNGIWKAFSSSWISWWEGSTLQSAKNSILVCQAMP